MKDQYILSQVVAGFFRHAGVVVIQDKWSFCLKVFSLPDSKASRNRDFTLLDGGKAELMRICRRRQRKKGARKSKISVLVQRLIILCKSLFFIPWRHVIMWSHHCARVSKVHSSLPLSNKNHLMYSSDFFEFPRIHRVWCRSQFFHFLLQRSFYL